MKLKITKKPFNIGTNARLVYRIVQILLIMSYTGGRNKKVVPLLKIHLLIWSLQSIERQQILLESKDNDYSISVGIWNIDRNTNQALTYMYEDNLCRINGKNYELSDEGKKLAKKIIDDKEIFNDEKEFLNKIDLTLTQKKVTKLRELWIS